MTDRRQRHVHDGDVDEVEERHRAQENQGEPASAGGEERGGGGRGRHRCSTSELSHDAPYVFSATPRRGLWPATDAHGSCCTCGGMVRGELPGQSCAIEVPG